MAVHFHFKNNAIKQFMTECVEALHVLRPELCEVCNRVVAEQGSRLHQVNGMSKKGHMMIVGALPQFFYAFIRQQARKRLGIDDIWRDSENMRLFFKVWTRAKVKTRRKQRIWLKDQKPVKMG